MNLKRIFLLCLLAGNTAFGRTDIAVADLKEIAMQSLAGKDIEYQIENINNESKQDLLRLENQIKEMEQAKNVDTRKIEEMQVTLYDMVRGVKWKISVAYQKAIAELDAAIKQEIRHIATKRKISVVLAKDAALFIDGDCQDITKEVLQHVNDNCPKIEVIVEHDINNEGNER